MDEPSESRAQIGQTSEVLAGSATRAYRASAGLLCDLHHAPAQPRHMHMWPHGTITMVALFSQQMTQSGCSLRCCLLKPRADAFSTRRFASADSSSCARGQRRWVRRAHSGGSLAASVGERTSTRVRSFTSDADKL